MGKRYDAEGKVTGIDMSGIRQGSAINTEGSSVVLTFQVMELPKCVWAVWQKQGHGGEMRLREILN